MRALRDQAEREANEAALRVGKGPKPKPPKAGNFFTKPRTIGGVSNWKEAGQGVAKGAKYAASHPGQVAKGVAKGAAGAAAIPALWNFGIGAGMDPRYFREAAGETENLYSNDREFGRIAGAAVQNQIPFYSSITGEETQYDKARALEKADKVTPRGAPWEVDMATQVRDLRKQGRYAEADAIVEQYRANKSHSSNGGEGVDISQYLGNNGGDGGLAGLASSMGMQGDPRGIASSFMGDSINTLRGMVPEAPDREALIAQERQYREAANIGNANDTAMAQYQEKIDKLPEEGKRDKWLSAAEGFFKMAEAGGESGSTFFGAAGAGGAAGLGAYNKSLTRLEAKQERLQDKMIEAQRYDEQLRMGDIREGTAEYRRIEDKRDTVLRDVAKIQAEEAKLGAEVAMHQMSIQASIAVAKISQAGRGGQQLDRLTSAFIQAESEGNVEAAAKILGMLNKIQGTLPAVQAANIRADASTSWLDSLKGGEQGEVGGIEFLGSRSQ